MANLEAAKKAVKAAGVKGFRRLKLKQTIYLIGRQGQFMAEHTAHELMVALENAGYRIQDKNVTLSLAAKGLLDCITIKED